MERKGTGHILILKVMLVGPTTARKDSLIVEREFDPPEDIRWQGRTESSALASCSRRDSG
jgi:hypothetical protein